MRSDLSELVTAPAQLPLGCRVLVVDDIKDNRDILRLLLQLKGITVFEAQDGTQAVEVACLQKPDGILMDLSMPVMDGFEATRQIKSCEATSHIPIAALSAHCGDEGQQEKALEAGCLYCLNKPFEWEKIDTFLQAL